MDNTEVKELYKRSKLTGDCGVVTKKDGMGRLCQEDQSTQDLPDSSSLASFHVSNLTRKRILELYEQR